MSKCEHALGKTLKKGGSKGRLLLCVNLAAGFALMVRAEVLMV